MTRKHAPLAIVLVLVLGGCLSEGPEEEGHGPTLTVRTGAPFMPDALTATTIASDSPVRALGVDGERVLVGTDAGLFSPLQGELTPVGLLAGEGEPAATGAIHALTARASGLFVAADEGLFHTYETRLLWSPLSALLEAGEPRALDAIGGGAEEQLWLATGEGLLHVAAGTAERFTLDGAACSPTAVLALGDVVLLGCSEGLFEIDPVALTFAAVPFELGAITALEDAGEGFAIVGTSAGLVERDASGRYTQYTLTDDETGLAVQAVTVDPSLGVLAVTDAGLVGAAREAAPVGIAPLPPGADRRVAVDPFGTVWIGDAAGVSSIPLGEPVGFEADVVPFFDTWCNDCHRSGINGAPKQDFTSYATVTTMLSAILMRLAQGTMPPSGASPTDEDIEVLLQWARTGMNP